MEKFLAQLDFELDPFQKEAIQVISEGHSVVVCAPTGSGKTIIAEYAATQAMESGRKLFYTTPLKALSNQKFHDLKKQYGENNVGLLTGDISINRDARIVVMTTEIFRNMLYGIIEESALLNDIGYLVLDECHYMNDAQRGTVWEETIIYCPEHIQIIALSATVANAEELTQWINHVHHDTRLVTSDFRPVPLRFSYFTREVLVSLFESKTNRLNKQLKNDRRDTRHARHLRRFQPNVLIEEMARRDMLPGIFFTFSRRDCDRHLQNTQRLMLLNDFERKQINQKIDEFLDQNPFLKENESIAYIRNGFASHHAGLLPGVKHLVEQLFQQGLIKAVFATETLAAGINMPARSTVITSISKRTNDGHRILTASEFLQMSGRAGRRGMDPVGYVVIVSTPFEGANEAAVLASSPPDALNSQFTPTYGMVLNLLQKHPLEECEFLIRKSFGQFTAGRRAAPLENAIQKRTKELEEALAFTCPFEVSDKEFHAYLRSGEMLQETAKFHKILQKQVKLHGKSDEILKQLSHEGGKLESLKKSVHGSPCHDCLEKNRHIQLEERVHRLQKKLKHLNQIAAREKDIYWRQFMDVYGLLKEARFLDEEDVPTESGKLTAQIRTENEFCMAEIIRGGMLDDLLPEQLAAVVSALVNDSTRENLWSRLSFSEPVHQAFVKIGKEMQRVEKLQRKHNVEVPVTLNPVASGLVEAWAQGIDWERMINSTNVDQGDLVRNIRRSADILRQLSRIDGVPRGVANAARLAATLIDRAPVKEVEMADLEDEAEKQASTQPADEAATGPESGISSIETPLEQS